jgi:hypothetical protein
MFSGMMRWAQSVLLPVWRMCWQLRRSNLEFLSQLLRGTPVSQTVPRYSPRKLTHLGRPFRHLLFAGTIANRITEARSRQAVEAHP